MVDQERSWAPARGGRELSEEMEVCLQDSLRAHRACLDAVLHTVAQGTAVGGPTLLRRLMDCAEICETNAHLLLLGSELQPRLSGVAAEACAMCAEACEAVPDDAVLRACAGACRQAAESAGGMAALTTA